MKQLFTAFNSPSELIDTISLCLRTFPNYYLWLNGYNYSEGRTEVYVDDENFTITFIQVGD